MKTRNFGPKISFPRGINKWISRSNGIVREVDRIHFVITPNGLPNDSEEVYSRRLIPGRKITVGDRFSVFRAKSFIVGANLNGKKVFYRDPRELALETV